MSTAIRFLSAGSTSVTNSSTSEAAKKRPLGSSSRSRAVSPTSSLIVRKVSPHNTTPLAKTSVMEASGSTQSLKPSASSTTQPRSPTGVAEVLTVLSSKRTSAHLARAAKSFGITSRGNQPRRREPRASSTARSACVVTSVRSDGASATSVDKVPSRSRTCPSCTTARSKLRPPLARVKQ